MRGDGIGPETVDCMLGILRDCGIQSEMVLCEAGSEQWERNGRKDASYIPEETMEMLKSSKACFKGPTTTIPDPGTPRSVAVTLRQRFDLYANIRPCMTYPGLNPYMEIDCVFFR